MESLTPNFIIIGAGLRVDYLSTGPKIQFDRDEHIVVLWLRPVQANSYLRIPGFGLAWVLLLPERGVGAINKSHTHFYSCAYIAYSYIKTKKQAIHSDNCQQSTQSHN